VWLHPGLQQRVGPAVDSQKHWPEVAHIRAHDPEVALVTRAAGDDERLAFPEPRLQRRELDALRQEPALLAEVLERVLGEHLERVGDAGPLLCERGLEPASVERPAGGETGSVAEDARAADRHRLPVA